MPDTPLGHFPFGQPVQTLAQTDRRPKRVFVLGVYASAVHARWAGPSGETLANALAVASEPYIFWRGDGAEEIVRQIAVPPEAGRLEPAEPRFNGPSGIALDELYLKPLGITRADAWLCDLVPHSCANPGQLAAVERAYLPALQRCGLPRATVPPVPAELADACRRAAVLGEIIESRCDTLVLLGDEPVRWFLSHYDSRWRCLRDFGQTADLYGRRHAVRLDGLRVDLIPLVHPRQAARLGASSERWSVLHQSWAQRERSPA